MTPLTAIEGAEQYGPRRKSPASVAGLGGWLVLLPGLQAIDIPFASLAGGLHRPCPGCWILPPTSVGAATIHSLTQFIHSFLACYCTASSSRFPSIIFYSEPIPTSLSSIYWMRLSPFSASGLISILFLPLTVSASSLYNTSVGSLTMLPPSDSFRHQSHKLAEMLASIQNGVAPAPPPPYGATDPYDSAYDETASNADAGEEWESNPRPISIHIDASISVLGNGNTVMIPSMSSHQQARAATSTSTEPSTPGATGILQSAQKQRQARLTEMTISIIAALQDSNLLSHNESGRHAPVEISINAGVKVEGSRNVICAGTPGRFASRKNAQNEPNDEELNAGRKRRAQSVCSRFFNRTRSALTRNIGAS